METIQKTELLELVKSSLATGETKASELIALAKSAQDRPHSLLMRMVLVAIGAVLALTGLGVLTAQHWQEFGVPLRIFLTFGAGLICLFSGMATHQSSQTKIFAQAFYLLALLLLPGGVLEVVYEAGFQLSADSTQIAMAAILAGLFAVPTVLFPSSSMLVGVIGALTWMFLAVTNTWLPDVSVISTYESYQYRALVIGAAYLLAAFGFKDSEYHQAPGTLYFVGSATILISAYSLMRYSPSQNIMWEMAYPVLCAGSIFGGIELKSRSLLFHGALALNAYVVRISCEYFSHSIGWPLSMILAGFSMIGIAIFTLGLYADSKAAAIGATDATR